MQHNPSGTPIRLTRANLTTAYRTQKPCAIWGIRQNDVYVLEVLPVPISMYFHDHKFMDDNGSGPPEAVLQEEENCWETL